ncbi:uncharacterized protein LOC106006978 [Mustela putorius furo]|uniref:Uncharacterized protein LOC106006978 n=1 Tax=Mustela putorius furo TaxID=9669 RepID=A0A8U0RI70_MUSPF|nr:uncharacterized protein LOC106006978 [Mustela putorius furo]
MQRACLSPNLPHSFPENKIYRNPFSVCPDHTRGFRGPFSVLQVPSNHSLEFGRAPKGLELSQAPNTSKPATTRPRNSNTSSRETENKRSLRTPAASEPHTPKRAPQGTAGASSGGLPIPTPPDRFPGLAPVVATVQRSWPRSGPLRAQLWGAEEAGPLRLLPAPRPLQRGRLLGLRPRLQLGRGRGPEALLSPSPASLPCVGLGAGRQEGVGANEPSSGGGNSGSSCSRKNLRGNNKATLSEMGELGRRWGGEGKKAGHWKEEKTEASQVSREVKSLARRRPTHVIPRCRCAAHPCVRDAEWAELPRKEMA